MRHNATLLWSWIVRITTAWLPDSGVTMRLRGRMYGLFMKERGSDFQVGSGARLMGLENISVGRHVYIAPGAVLLACCQIRLGDEVMVAHQCILTDSNHSLVGTSYRYGRRKDAPIKVGDGTWIAANATIVAGVTLGKGVLVAANSVVTKDMPDLAIVGGVPARVLRIATVMPGVSSTGDSPGS